MTVPDVLPRATHHIEPDRRAHRDAARPRPRLPHRRRVDLLPDRVLARLWPAGAAGSGRSSSGGAGRGRRVRQGRRPGLRALEGPEGRRTRLRDGDRTRPSGLAHRMLSHEHDPPRAVVRHPHRRHRPHLPAPRGRDRPERGGDRPDLRRHLAPLRAPADERLEDGQVDGQHRPGRRGPRDRRLGTSAATGAHLGPLPGRTQPLARIRWSPPAPRSTGSTPRSRPSARTSRTVRTTRRCRTSSRPPGPTSARRSTTTSTCRPVSPSCSTSSATSTGASSARSMSTEDAGRALETLRDVDRVLAILPDAEPAEDLDPAVASLLDARVDGQGGSGLRCVGPVARRTGRDRCHGRGHA